MKKLNEEATRIFLGIIAQIPAGETSIKIENNKIYMALHVDKLCYTLQAGGSKAEVYSFAHYYEQNGDLMKDPDVEFAVVDNRSEEYPILDLVAIYPITFQQDNLGIFRQLAIIENQVITKYNKRWQPDCAHFCNKWMSNLKQQQKTTPAKVLNLGQYAMAQAAAKRQQFQ